MRPKCYSWTVLWFLSSTLFPLCIHLCKVSAMRTPLAVYRSTLTHRALTSCAMHAKLEFTRFIHVDQAACSCFVLQNDCAFYLHAVHSRHCQKKSEMAETYRHRRNGVKHKVFAGRVGDNNVVCPACHLLDRTVAFDIHHGHFGCVFLGSVFQKEAQIWHSTFCMRAYKFACKITLSCMIGTWNLGFWDERLWLYLLWSCSFCGFTRPMLEVLRGTVLLWTTNEQTRASCLRLCLCSLFIAAMFCSWNPGCKHGVSLTRSDVDDFFLRICFFRGAARFRHASGAWLNASNAQEQILRVLMVHGLFVRLRYFACILRPKIIWCHFGTSTSLLFHWSGPSVNSAVGKESTRLIAAAVLSDPQWIAPDSVARNITCRCWQTDKCDSPPQTHRIWRKCCTTLRCGACSTNLTNKFAEKCW